MAPKARVTKAISARGAAVIATDATEAVDGKPLTFKPQATALAAASAHKQSVTKRGIQGERLGFVLGIGIGIGIGIGMERIIMYQLARPCTTTLLRNYPTTPQPKSQQCALHF
jgi:hypothetical protein